MVIGLGAARS